MRGIWRRTEHGPPRLSSVGLASGWRVHDLFAACRSDSYLQPRSRPIYLCPAEPITWTAMPEQQAPTRNASKDGRNPPQARSHYRHPEKTRPLERVVTRAVTGTVDFRSPRPERHPIASKPAHVFFTAVR